MKKFTRYFWTAVGCLLINISAQAESQFQGFYGQISTGYENNRFANINPSWVNATQVGDFPFLHGTGSASTQSISSMPLVLGAGYFADLENNFMFGVGIDYSPLAQSTGDFNHTSTRADGAVFPFDSMSYQVSNRVNVFIMPGYAFASDKLGYVKLGYSTQTLKYSQNPNSAGLTSSFSSSANLDGFIVGLGYKQIVTDGLYGFGEANYITYANTTINGNAQADTSTINMSSSPSVSAYNFLLGIGYKF